MFFTQRWFWMDGFLAFFFILMFWSTKPGVSSWWVQIPTVKHQKLIECWDCRRNNKKTKQQPYSSIHLLSRPKANLFVRLRVVCLSNLLYFSKLNTGSIFLLLKVFLTTKATLSPISLLSQIKHCGFIISLTYNPLRKIIGKWPAHSIAPEKYWIPYAMLYTS